MKPLDQTLEDILESLSSLEADWMDDDAQAAMAKIESVPVKGSYDRADIEALIDAKNGKRFEISQLCIRLFLGLSKDLLEAELKDRLGTGGVGVKRYHSDHETYLDVLEAMGLREAMSDAVNRDVVWSDILRERLRSGRGSAIQGQQRGRGLEDFAEAVIQSVFGDGYEARCTFQGVSGTAKCDFAIPSRDKPLILIEAKGYQATGSKMTDIIGDVDAIIGAKRHDARLLLITDGLSWKARANDLRKLIQRQNDGRIMRLYTKNMVDQLKRDLETLKSQFVI